MLKYLIGTGLVLGGIIIGFELLRGGVKQQLEGEILIFKLEGCGGGSLLKVTALNNTNQVLESTRVELTLGKGPVLKRQFVDVKNWNTQQEKTFSVKRPALEDANACLARFFRDNHSKPIPAKFRPQSNEQFRR